MVMVDPVMLWRFLVLEVEGVLVTDESLFIVVAFVTLLSCAVYLYLSGTPVQRQI